MSIEREHGKTYQSGEARRIGGWFDPRGRGLGMWALAVHRITGIGLVVYLVVHLLVLSLLVQGQAGWDAFIALARTPAFLALDVILIAGVLIHGLNGVRVTLIGVGFGLRRQGSAFVGLMMAVAVVVAYVAWRILAN
jgi:succinate dehydrogenase / fumarate reductase cytochrome b subunit